MTATRAACVLAFMLFGARGRDAAADGETSPMVGFAAFGGEAERSPTQASELAGVALDLAWWHGPFGLAVEGGTRWTLDGDRARAFAAGGSARLRVLEAMVPSLIDPRDCELGLELQAIVERSWWNASISQSDATAYGIGIALRVRGGGDQDGELLIAESRFFVRVMAARWNEVDVVARTMSSPGDGPDRALTVLAGIGASWGSVTAGYMDRFRPRPFGGALLW